MSPTNRGSSNMKRTALDKALAAAGKAISSAASQRLAPDALMALAVVTHGIAGYMQSRIRQAKTSAR